ncbi:MAG: FHA domain-containing protein [Chloroflexota bacterium]
MTLAIVLLVLRVVSALLLLCVVGLVFLVIWRDYQSATVEIEASRRVYGYLVGLQEIDESYIPTGETFPLMAITSIGRAPINTIRLDDQFASSEHCAVYIKNGVWWLEDRNSSNGTNLNRMAVQEPVIVTSGDIVTIGTRHFRLEIEGF